MDPWTAESVQIFKKDCRDPWTADLIRTFKGECRDLRTAAFVRIYKGDGVTHEWPIRSLFLKPGSVVSSSKYQSGIHDFLSKNGFSDFENRQQSI